MNEGAIVRVRRMSAEERRANFMNFMRRYRQSQDAVEASRWHYVDSPITMGQENELPGSLPSRTYTRELWIKFSVGGGEHVAVSRSRFNYGTGRWTTQFCGSDVLDEAGMGLPIAWADTVDGWEPSGA